MTDWTEEQIETADRMWRQGFTARQIAPRVGRTRNSVIGHLYRAKCKRDKRFKPNKAKSGLPAVTFPEPVDHVRVEANRLRNEGLDDEEIAQTLQVSFRRPRSKRSAPPRKAPAMTQEPVSAPTCSPVTLLDRTAAQCAWPVADSLGPLTPMCGAPTVTGSYCIHHQWIAFQPVQQYKR